jgi:hypothetical protein
MYDIGSDYKQLQGTAWSPLPPLLNVMKNQLDIHNDSERHV